MTGPGRGRPGLEAMGLEAMALGTPSGSARRQARRAVRLDARGRRCPLPVLDLARHIAEVPVGEAITVEADDPGARSDIPAWCRMRGHEYLGASEAADGTPAYSVRRLH